MKKLFKFLVAVFMGLALTSCGNIVIQPILNSVELNKETVTLEVGQTETLEATISPENLANGTTITWSTTNDKVATVNDKGVVTAVEAGTAKIMVTATRGTVKRQDTCTVKVLPKEIPVTGITLDKNEGKLYVGESITLTPTVLPNNATNKSVTWSTSDANVATVNDGLVSAIKAGNVTITVTTKDGNKNATCTITVIQPVTGVVLDKQAHTLNVGENFTLTATVNPDDAENKEVTWSSSDAAVATVNNGKVSAIKAGTATITVKTADGNKEASCVVTVLQPVTGIELDAEELALVVGEDTTLVATVLPSDASNKEVTWTSNNTAVATVNAEGKVIAVGPGSAVITATTVDGNKTSTCTVTVVEFELPATGVVIEGDKNTLVIEETLLLEAVLTPANSTDNVAWSSSNENVATVSQNGLVTALTAGTTTIKVKVGTVEATYDITVNKNTVVVSGFEDKVVTYGSNYEFIYTVSSNQTVSLEYYKGETKLAAKPTNAGEYNVKLTLAENDKYNAFTKTVKLTINKKEVNEPTISGTYTYNGSEQTVTVSGLESYMSVAGNKGTNAGNYEVVITLDDNHKWAEGNDGVVTWSIAKASVELPKANENLVYNKEEQTGVESSTLYTVTNGKATNAGEYKATVELVDEDNYEWVEEFNGVLTWSIGVAKLTAPTIAESINKTYNGEEMSITVDVTLTEVEVKATVKYYLDKECTEEFNGLPVNAGKYYVTIEFSSEDPNYGTNYEKLEGKTRTVTINKKAVFVTWEGTTSYVYDGTAKDSLMCKVTENVIEGDDVSVRVIGELNPKEIGEYIYTIELVGEDAGNYYVNEKYLSQILVISVPSKSSKVDVSMIGNLDTTAEYALVTKGHDGKYYTILNTLTGTKRVFTDTDCIMHESIEGISFASTELWSFVLKEGTTDEYYIKSGDKYLYGTDSTSNKTNLVFDTNKEKASTWKLERVSEESDNYFIISTNGTNRALMYNGSEKTDGSLNSVLGFYSKSSEIEKGYNYVTLYKVSTESPVSIGIQDPSSTDGTVVSSKEDLSSLYSFDKFTLTVTPVYGRTLVSVKLMGGNDVLNTYDVVPTSDGTFVVEVIPTHSGTIVFEFAETQLKHSVIVNEFENGSIIGELLEQYEENQTVTFTVEALDGYHIAGVEVTTEDGNIKVENEGNTYSFIMPTKDAVITVTINENYKITIEEIENVVIKVTNSKNEEIVNGTKVPANTEIKITVIVNLGYKLDKVYVNNEESENVVAVNEDITISATVVEIPVSTIAEIKAAIDASSPTKEIMKVSGTVKSISNYNPTHHSYNCIITDGKDEFTLYNANAPKNDTLHVGDKVVALGYGKIYNGTYEFYVNNDYYPQIISITHSTFEIVGIVLDENDTLSTKAKIINLQTSAKCGETVEFSVSVDDGYKVIVTVNGTTKPNENDGVYSFVIEDDTEVVVKVIEEGTIVQEASWVLVDLVDIQPDDQVVVVWTKGNESRAMSNDKGTSSGPAAVQVTIEGDKLSGNVPENIKWNISNNGGNLTIYPNGKTNVWLYTTSSNNGVRVGTNANKVFTIDASSGYLKNTATSRYLGVYNNQDLRCYTTINDNIKGQAISFYKYSEGGSNEPTCEHANKITTTVDATCTKDGSSTVSCEDCNAVFNTTLIPATGHTYVDGVCSCGEQEPQEQWTLVTNVNDLQVGDIIVIVAKDSEVALSTTQNGNNRGTATVSKKDSQVTFGNDVQRITIEAGKADGTLAFNVGGGYLYAASSGSNHLKTETALSNNSSWKIEIASTGVATIKAQGTNTRNWLRFNSSSKIFSCYASGQGDILIYKLS